MNGQGFERYTIHQGTEASTKRKVNGSERRDPDGPYDGE